MSHLSSASLLVALAIGAALPSRALAAAPPRAPLRPQVGPPSRLFDQLAAVYPYSDPNALTTTTNGRFLFVGEGGSIAFIDTMDPIGFDVAIKRLPVSSQGVMPVELLVDPDADLVNQPADPKSVLYVAGGRFGLWAMQANPTAGVANRAARIDDALSIQDVGQQRSNRWCSDVGVMRLGTTDYIVALFAKKDGSRLRAYPLSAARAVLGFMEETGHELTPLVDVQLNGHPNPPSPASRSFAYGMDVDGTDVYVALGSHGIVRVSITSLGIPPQFSVTGGPIFGDGTAYDQPPDHLYDHYRYYPASLTQPPPPPPAPVFEHAPIFTDVAVQNFPVGQHYLYAAVDHLGWVRFDLAQTFNNSMPIQHQEGVIYTNNVGEKHILLRASPDTNPTGTNVKVRTYARRIRVVNTPAGPTIAVAASHQPILLHPKNRTEGRAQNHLTLGPFDPAETSDLSGEFTYTFLYQLPLLLPSPVVNFDGFLRSGADEVHLPRLEGTLTKLVVYGSESSRPPQGLGQDPALDLHSTFRAEFEPWPTVTGERTAFVHRSTEDRPGKYNYDISYSFSNPDVLQTGGNEAGLATEGILIVCNGNEIRPFYPYDPTAPPDTRGQNGIIFNPRAQWVAATGSDVFSYLWNVGMVPDPPPGTDQHRPRWRWIKFDAGTDVCNPQTTDPPDREKRVYFETPPDRFLSQGRGHYNGGMLSQAYDLTVQTPTTGHPGWEIVFGTSWGTTQGAVVMRRDLLSLDAENLAQDEELRFPASIPGAVLGRLITHPEYDNVLDAGTDPGEDPDAEDFLKKIGTFSNVGSMYGQLFRLSLTGSGTLDRWVLVVPSMAVQLDPALPVFTFPGNPMEQGGYHPDWAPDSIYGQNLDHLMLRFFDVTDPATVGNPATVKTYTAIGPRLKSAAARVETIEFGGKVYCFASDYGGSIVVYDVTQLLTLPSGSFLPAPFEEWVAPLSISEDFANNIYGIALDRAQWTDTTGAHDEVYVYAGVSRLGVAVLRFVPNNPLGARFERLKIIQTPGETANVTIRVHPVTGEKTLLVADSTAGIRIYKYPAD